VSPDTLRHYERLGLLPPPRRNAAGYRQYPEDTVARVRVIRAALAVGFTLVELGAIFRMRARGEAPCRTVRSLARVKLADLEERLAELQRLRDRLRTLLGDWDDRLAGTSPGHRAGLLEALADAPPPPPGPPRLPLLGQPPRPRRSR
jgi:DNA-binding transcriptional MerR regulator